MDHPDAPAGKGRKYAIVERERRWLLARLPSGTVTKVADIHDRYVEGTRIRLRRMAEAESGRVTTHFKLTQKVPAPGGGPGLLTTFYLSEAEHAVLAGLPARELRKRRHSIPPFGVDVFEGPLAGLVIAEAEYASDPERDLGRAPEGALAEVTHDVRFTGGRFVTMDAAELAELLAGFR